MEAGARTMHVLTAEVRGGAAFITATRVLQAEARVSTKVVAADIPIAVSSLFDTPINGHKPKNWTRTKLFTSTVPTRSSAYSANIPSSSCAVLTSFAQYALK